jgi:3-hydroxymyristoyl/3-hydroxydecanoyl-(acyl carrier protein) dehydratase
VKRGVEAIPYTPVKAAKASGDSFYRTPGKLCGILPGFKIGKIIFDNAYHVNYLLFDITYFHVHIIFFLWPAGLEGCCPAAGTTCSIMRWFPSVTKALSGMKIQDGGVKQLKDAGHLTRCKFIEFRRKSPMLYDMNMSARKHGEDGTLSAEVYVPAGASWFDGHFPGWPVLPGIAQLGMVYELVRHALDGPVRVAEVSRVRFKQRIAPDDRLTVVAELRPGGGRYAFRITRGDEVVCTGTMTVATEQLQTSTKSQG